MFAQISGIVCFGNVGIGMWSNIV